VRSVINPEKLGHLANSPTSARFYALVGTLAE
jgi:hypothetical protein